MRAVRCHDLSGPASLRVDEVERPTAGPGEVVIDVKAAGVNFPDVLITQGKYQFKPDLPFSPGGEVAGVVRDIGPGVTGIRPGDRVIAATTWGGYAEEVVAEAKRIIPMPEGMDFSTAAAFVPPLHLGWRGDQGVRSAPYTT